MIPIQERLARLTEYLLEHGFVDAPETLKAAADELDRLQAKIDALMLEYCPDEMTTEQMQEWERHQKPGKQAQPAEPVTTERERCAQLCERYAKANEESDLMVEAFLHCAAKIRTGL